MSSDIINLRFGYRHLHIGKWYIRVSVNPYWILNKPDKWFEVYL